MEQVERTDMGVERGRKAYGRYSWIILFASTILGVFGGVLLMFPTDPTSQLPGALWIVRAWGITLVGFNIFALVLSAGPYRKGKRWAWYTLWLVPVLLVGYFVVVPNLSLYLVLAILAALGLILPYRRFFPGREENSV
jgi:cell division protein FtsW (lipid II flippase)